MGGLGEIQQGSALVSISTAELATVELVGEIDIASSEAVRAALEALEATRPELVIVDVSRVTFMDSSGLAVLLSLAKNSERVELRSVTSQIRKLIEVTGLHAVLHMSTPDCEMPDLSVDTAVTH